MPKIIVVCANEFDRKLFADILNAAEISALGVENVRAALASAGAEEPDIYVVRVLPPPDGIEDIKLLRQHSDRPVFVLDSPENRSFAVGYLVLGTDDYLTLPMDSEEFVERVKALLRREKPNTAHTLSVGALTLDRDKTDIPQKEFELLWKLAAAAGKTVTRDTIIEDIWGYDFEGNERTIDVHIGRLRERFPPERYGFKIAAVRGVGYRLKLCAPQENA
ncbi:MAG: response regulator transcription factor [Oscillospiraceae bacterium]|jgi:DNA-binding response OmpR family regulator|nr:response regulator transcription factor [Oscillospiraceae bacterium]